MNEGNRFYCGDSVFADVENGMVKLTTENGIESTNTIYLEPEVMSQLLGWYDRVLAKYDRSRKVEQ